MPHHWVKPAHKPSQLKDTVVTADSVTAFSSAVGRVLHGAASRTQATRTEMFLASFYEGLYNNKLQFCGTTAVWNKFTVPEKATVKEELSSKTIHPAASCSSSTSLFRPLLGFEIPQFKFRVALCPQRPFTLLEAGSPGWPPRLSHSS